MALRRTRMWRSTAHGYTSEAFEKDCRAAVAEGQALFAIATKLQVRLSHEVDKSKELEKLMDQQKHNLNNLPIRKEDDRRKVAN